jgi:SAM-dependent methyltransferase
MRKVFDTPSTATAGVIAGVLGTAGIVGVATIARVTSTLSGRAEAAAGRAGVSEPLRRFVAEFPHERGSIFDFVLRAARATPVGARVADVGAGDAPYRELFAHADYTAIDWESSLHEGIDVDLTAPADAIPVEDGVFDVVLLTQVLEHVPEPGRVLGELHRILKPGGCLYITVPLTWELHELPHDYYRYTAAGLDRLLTAAGFDPVAVEPRNDCFTTIAQLMLNIRSAMGRAEDGLDERREAAAGLLTELAEQVAELEPLDARHVFPLGYAATARRP